MAIPKDDRIAFSKKIVLADLEKASIDRSQQEILVSKAEAQKLDNANKNLMDVRTPFINSYQSELSVLDGNVRTQLTETDVQNSGDKVLGNFFFPNNISALPPSLSAPWAQTKPYARTIAVGRTNSEGFAGSTTTEAASVAPVNSAITAIEGAYTNIQRTTGQECVETGFCSLPFYTNELDCVTNGYSWTDTGDLIQTYADVHTDLTDLINKVNTYRAFLVSQSAAIITNDTNNARNTQNLTAKNNIDSVIIPAIDAWLALPNFDTTHGQTTCVGFNSYDISLLSGTKLRPTELNTLKTALSTRAAFLPTRVSQLETNLGGITQNLSNGSSTGSGLYFERFQAIQLRLNILGGSLSNLKGFDRANSAQIELKDNIDSTKAAYLAVIYCSPMSAPANNTKFIQVKDASGFLAGDTIYIITESQEELTRKIVSINGNRIELGEPVPAKYRESELGRVYKEV